MDKKEEEFLQELEKKLDENRKIVSRSILPKPFYGVASYLGFHPLRVLVGLSLLTTVILFGKFFGGLMLLSRKIFLF